MRYLDSNGHDASVARTGGRLTVRVARAVRRNTLIHANEHEEYQMQTDKSQQKQDAKQPMIDTPAVPEQESTGRGTGTGNATGFVDPAHAVEVEKNRDASRGGDPNDLGAAGDYSR